ncbi:hypothetical protein ZWY2020_024243 [Hordeum vulgare]|nr:hypothetical protein ZWY2020_024243 [Hordeum vulgare]
MMFPLHFHYEDVLRQDLLLKLNHANVMEVPRLCEITLVPKGASDFRVQFGKLAMGILCHQRFIQTQTLLEFRILASALPLPYVDAWQSHFDPIHSWGPKKDTGYVSDFARQSILRGHGMYHFLVRILTVMSMLDSPIKIRENSIKYFLETEFCEFSPEMEDHFEIFEHIRGFNVTIFTSADTKDETLLLWSGFVIMELTSKKH